MTAFERALRDGTIRSCDDCGEYFKPEAGETICVICVQYEDHYATLAGGFMSTAPTLEQLYGKEAR